MFMLTELNRVCHVAPPKCECVDHVFTQPTPETKLNQAVVVSLPIAEPNSEPNTTTAWFSLVSLVTLPTAEPNSECSC